MDSLYSICLTSQGAGQTPRPEQNFSRLMLSTLHAQCNGAGEMLRLPGTQSLASNLVLVTGKVAAVESGQRMSSMAVEPEKCC